MSYMTVQRPTLSQMKAIVAELGMNMSDARVQEFLDVMQGTLDAYDVVFLDTPPALGYLTTNGLAAADILLVPVGASFLEFDSTPLVDMEQVMVATGEVMAFLAA